MGRNGGLGVCPRCIGPMASGQDDSYSLGTRLNIFSCPGCGYRGFPVWVEARDLPKLRAKLKGKR